MVLVDTSIIIDFFNTGKFKDSIIALLSNKEFATAEIIMMEVLQGIKDDKSYETTKIFLDSLPLISIKHDDYLDAANIYRTCRKNGVTIRNSIDCLIASIVINNNLRLFSNDRDFNHIQKFFNLEKF